MQIEEIQHYFKQIYRILKPDGMCFSTFFLYDKSSEDFVANNRSFAFPVKKDGYRLMSENVKSGNIAIHKGHLNQMLEGENFEIIAIVDGFWKNNIRDGLKKEYQDIVVFKKRERFQ